MMRWAGKKRRGGKRRPGEEVARDESSQRPSSSHRSESWTPETKAKPCVQVGPEERRAETWVIRVIPARGWQAPALLSSEATSPLLWPQAPTQPPPSPPPRLAHILPPFLTRASGGACCTGIQEGQRKLTWSREGRPQAPGAPLMGLHHHLGTGQRPSLRPGDQPTLPSPSPVPGKKLKERNH